MKISVIIPAFNEERLLGETLRQVKTAMEAFARCGWNSELIVCDNNSTDRTTEIAREAGVIVVFEAVNQIARARNRGASIATGDWLVFVDADSHPSVELFTDVAEQIKSSHCLAGGVTVQLDEKHFVAGLVTRLWNCASRIFKLPAGSFIFCEAAAYRKIGGFNNELFAAEELELSKRLWQLARHTNKKVVILHRHPLITSARKMRLYSSWEHLRLLARVIFSRGRILRNREAAHLWYDGRR